MLEKLVLKKYRCYELHEVNFQQLTIIIGKNNAGKSTLIEALRLVSLISNRFKTATYNAPPAWLELPKGQYGISPSLERLEFSFKNIINQYETPPAIIEAYFTNNERVTLYLNDLGNIFASIFDKNGNVVNSRQAAKDISLFNINILPQISPLLEDENALDENYVRANVFSSLASRHFRNQLSYYNEYFSVFKNLAEETWNGLRIVELIKSSKKIQTIEPVLLVQEGGYVTEVGLMGHGLQMWLQTIWFLARTPVQNTIVLDEPDVYMHADLQRKLIRTLKGKYGQVIIATHSLEIMAEVDYENILVIDRRKEKSLFASNFPAIQDIIYNDIGSVHNLQLARLWSAKKLLIVEGEEISLLKKVQDILFPKSNEPFDNIPSFDMGGWGGWSYAIGSQMIIKNAGDENIKIYCIFDSDYHIKPDIEERYEEAKKKNINLHIWNRKEFENYFVIPSVIFRLIEKKSKNRSVTLSHVENNILQICNNFKQEVEDDYASEILKYFRGKNKILDFTDNDKEVSYEAKNANKLARKIVSEKWGDPINVVPGKKLVKEINKWLTDEYKININLLDIIKEMTKLEISQEMKQVIEKIETCQNL